MVGNQVITINKPRQAVKGQVSNAELLRYFIPLAIQAASQSLTYPLVASIASRAPGGPLNYAGIAQANGIMFLLGTLGAGLVTTGMVYATTREGFARFQKLNLLIALVVFVMQIILCVPVVAHYFFHSVMNLPGSIEHPAYQALLITVPLQFLFFLRNPYQVCLYTHNATTLASGATIFRIVATVILVPIFISLHLIGPVWAVVAQTIPVGGEVLFSWIFARRYMRYLPKSRTAPATVREQLFFTIPLSVGGLFLSLSGIVLCAVIARAPDPERMTQAYFLASGLSGPAAVAASRMQPVVLTYLPRIAQERLLVYFALLMGLLLGGIPLLFILPGLEGLYYGSVQKCPPSLLPLVRVTVIGLLFHPFTMAIRAYMEGKAALLKHPMAILGGQAVFLGMLTIVAIICAHSPFGGGMLAPISLFAANVAAAGLIFTLLPHNPLLNLIKKSA